MLLLKNNVINGEKILDDSKSILCKSNNDKLKIVIMIQNILMNVLHILKLKKLQKKKIQLTLFLNHKKLFLI